MARRHAGRCLKMNHSWLMGLAVMEISPQLHNLCVIFMVLSHSQMWTKPGSNYSVRPIRALRCCLQRGMHWPCTFVVPTTRQSKQIVNTSTCHLLQKHQAGQRNKTACCQCGQDYLQPRCLSSTCHLCVQIQMPDSSMQLHPERSEMYSCLWLRWNRVL